MGGDKRYESKIHKCAISNLDHQLINKFKGSNIARLLYAGEAGLNKNIMTDIHDVLHWKEWFSNGVIFGSHPEGAVPQISQIGPTETKMSNSQCDNFFVTFFNLPGCFQNIHGFSTIRVTILPVWKGID